MVREQYDEVRIIIRPCTPTVQYMMWSSHDRTEMSMVPIKTSQAENAHQILVISMELSLFSERGWAKDLRDGGWRKKFRTLG